MDCTNKKGKQDDLLEIVYGDMTTGVHGRNFDYIFSYQKGGLESLVIEGKEWLYRTPMPTFWRAVTDNDRGNGFPLRSGMWLGADCFIKCVGEEIFTDGKKTEDALPPENNRYEGSVAAETIRIHFTYQTITEPAATVEVSYEVGKEGSILVDVHYHGVPDLPELPVFGMRFVMPTKALGYRYEGLSGETYPDRMAGGIPGIYEVQGLPVTPYLVPQDCGVHMNTRWLEVKRNTTLNNSDRNSEEFKIRFESKGEEFAFSCLPYTAEELENATHQEELPPPRRTVVSILKAVRGVGGIDSWGADVETDYRIDASKDIRYSFTITF